MITKLTTMTKQDATNRQLAGAARFGRKITITSPECDDPIEGYVAGFDEESIFVAVPRYEPDRGWVIGKFMIHRDWYAMIELHDQSTLSREQPQARDALEKMMHKFRERVTDEYFPNRT